MTDLTLHAPAAPNETTDRPRRWGGALGVLAALALAVPLAGHAVLGSFSRYIADDFCTAAFVRTHGLWTSQVVWYTTWSGRYAFTFLISVFHLIGPRLTPWLPGLALVVWMAVLVAFFRRWTGLTPRRWSWLPVVLLAGLALTLALRGAPNVYQSLYWETGMLTYSLPLLLGTAYLAWLTREVAHTEGGTPVGMAALLGSAAVTFVTGGFSETYVSLQTGALAAGLLGAALFFRGARRGGAVRLLAAGLIGSALAMTVVVIAPGNEVRRSLMAAPPGLWLLIQRTLHDVYIYIYAVAKHQTVALILSLTVPFLLAILLETTSGPASPDEARRWRLAVLAVPPLTAWMVTIPFAPSEYAVSYYPDDRVMITQQYVLFLGLVLWSWCVGRWAMAAVGSRVGRVRPAALVAVVPFVAVLLWFAVGSVQNTVEEIPTYRDYAATWDHRDQVLRQAAIESPGAQAVASLRHMGGLAEIGDNPDEWVNVCVADTYDVEAVVAK